MRRKYDSKDHGTKALSSFVLNSFKEGQGWAFSAIYQQYRTPIFCYISDRVQNEAIAEEVTQDVFIKVLRSCTSYQSSFAFSTWLWTITKNTLTDFFRKNSKWDMTSELDQIACQNPSADLLLEKKNQKQLLMWVSRNLTRMQRRVLWMRIIYQLPYQEIAKHMRLSVSSVKCLVYRAKELLKSKKIGDEHIGSS